MHIRPLLSVATLAVLLAACGAAEPTDTTAVPTTTTTSPTTTVPTTTTTTPSVSPGFDWDDRASNVELPGGWTIAFCEGEAPLVCVARDGEVVGVIERFIADPATYTAYDPSQDDETNLRAFAADYVAVFEQDRAVGCGEGYIVEPVEVEPVDFGGSAGLAYGFRGSLADGSASELHLQYSVLSHGRLIVLAAGAYDEGGCPGKDDLTSFDSATLEEFRPALEGLLATSPLPGGDLVEGVVLPDGYTFVWIEGFEDGKLLIDPAWVLSGDEARAQAVKDGVIGEGEDLPNDYYIFNPTEDVIPVAVGDEAKWTVIGPGEDGALAARESDRATIEAIFAGGDTGDIYGLVPDFMPFDLLVVDGEVVEVNQRYFP